MGVVAAWLACALLGLLGAPARGVVHTTEPGSGNTTPPTPPANDPGFYHVGVTGNGLTGIYLGNRWVLTAGHVGEQSITLGGVTYPVIAGSRVQLQHSPGVYADLALERLLTAPPLAPLVLSTASPAAGNGVTMIGNGWDRQSGQFCWRSTWVEVNCTSPFAVYRGYKRLGSARTMRWGSNLVSVAPMDEPVGGVTTRAFALTFDQSGVADEAQAVSGDSGGAVFMLRGSQWELVGVMFSILIYSGQPYDTTAVFGTETLAADVFFYKSQILALMSPPPQIPALPWPALVLGAAGIAAAARGGLRRSRTR